MKPSQLKLPLLATIGALMLMAQITAGQAAELKILVSAGFVPIMKEIGPRFEAASGYKLAVATDTLGQIVRRVGLGEQFDLVLGPQVAITGFVYAGKTTKSTVKEIATSGMGLAVRAGAAKPDISSTGALKATLLAAKSFATLDPKNTEGNPELAVHVTKVLGQLGIADSMAPKTVYSGTNDVGGTVARGEAEVGIAQLQNLGRVKGIDIVGPLPDELQDPVVFSAAIMNGAREIDAAKALIEFLLAPGQVAAFKAHRMDPARR